MSTTQLRFTDRLSQWFGQSPKEGMDALPVRVHGREFARTAAAPVSIRGFDQSLIWGMVVLLLWGLVMVYSASVALNTLPSESCAIRRVVPSVSRNAMIRSAELTLTATLK